MSWQASAWANSLPYDACGPLAFRVLSKLADVADERGERAWRSKAQLADELGVSARSIQRAFKDLEMERLIVRGDQRYVMHLRADRRPTVYDCNLRHSGVTTASVALWNGETELSTGETTAVAHGETTAVARTTPRTTSTQVLNPATDRVRAVCARIRAGRDHLLDTETGVCAACGERP